MVVFMKEILKKACKVGTESNIHMMEFTMSGISKTHKEME